MTDLPDEFSLHFYPGFDQTGSWYCPHCGEEANYTSEWTQVLKVPIEAFINWLIYQAAKADGDDFPEPYYNHRCIYCKRFIPRKLVVMGVNFCNPQHLDGYLNRMKLLENNNRRTA